MKQEPKPAHQVLAELQNAFAAGKQASLQVTGTSMVPFLRHEKDWVLLEPLNEPPRRGQILLFSQGNRLVLHRLRKICPGYYIMNGDGRREVEKVPVEQVHGVAAAVVRRSGRVFPCDGWCFRLMSALWWPTRPLRPWLLPFAEGMKRRIRKRS